MTVPLGMRCFHMHMHTQRTPLNAPLKCKLEPPFQLPYRFIR